MKNQRIGLKIFNKHYHAFQQKQSLYNCGDPIFTN